MPLSEHVAEDYVATGLSLKEHPVSFFRERLEQLGVMRNVDHRSEALRQNRRITVAGLVLTRQMPGAKGVVFVTLEDETDIANIIVWPKVFARNRRTVMTSRFLAVRGRLQRAGLVVHVLAESFIDLSAELPRLYGDDLFAVDALKDAARASRPPAEKPRLPLNRRGRPHRVSAGVPRQPARTHAAPSPDRSAMRAAPCRSPAKAERNAPPCRAAPS